MEKAGVIYILTSPSFPEYVKIGYADDVKKRLTQLNKSECIPFAFRVYATYEVSSRLSDLKIHEIIDRLNPDLRSIESFEGKKRVREFYAMSPEDAFELLRAIAEINGMESNLKLIAPNKEEKQAEKLAEEISARNENFSFTKCNIPIGAELEYVRDANIKCHVVDDRRVRYNGQIMYLTGLAKLLLNTTKAINGTLYFHYKGKSLTEYYDLYQRKG
jgi:hypothetical protein